MKKHMLLAAVAVLLVAGCAGVDKKLAEADAALAKVDQTVNRAVDVATKAVDTAVKVETKVADAVAKVEDAKGRLAAAVAPDKHTVEKGDSLWRIDQRHGGDGFGWYGIYRQNRDQITDYNVIEPGQVFTWSKLQANTPDNRLRAYREPPYKAK